MINPIIQTARPSRSSRAVAVESDLFEMAAMHREILADSTIGSGTRFASVLPDFRAQDAIYPLGQKLGSEIGS